MKKTRIFVNLFITLNSKDLKEKNEKMNQI